MSFSFLFLIKLKTAHISMMTALILSAIGLPRFSAMNPTCKLPSGDRPINIKVYTLITLPTICGGEGHHGKVHN
mgnify:CR=1 FL=1